LDRVSKTLLAGAIAFYRRSAIAPGRVAKTARFARSEDAAHISEMITGTANTLGSAAFFWRRGISLQLADRKC
jgi:hypothetical protein